MKKTIILLLILMSNIFVYSQKDTVSVSVKDSTEMYRRIYNNMENSLDAISNHEWYTFFIGVDRSFVDFRLSNYLQQYMYLTPETYKYNKDGSITMYYVPKISSEKEYFNITYYTTKSKHRSWDGISKDKCYIINKVVIVGTSDLIINFFVKFWPNNIKIGGFKKGEIAHYDYSNDRASIYGISINKYKIVISKGVGELEYYKLYDVK